MIYRWENQEQRLLRFMKISPKKKMEWLAQMHEFLRKAFSKRQRLLFLRVREHR